MPLVTNQWLLIIEVINLKKSNVLKKSTDFDRIIHNNKSFCYRNYIIYVERNTNEKYHFGLSVGKKVGNAVTRNRVKRQLRSIIDEKCYQNNFNCIIIVKKGILEESFDSMKNNLFIAFEKLNILKEN